jgi:hypothetical protein
MLPGKQVIMKMTTLQMIDNSLDHKSKFDRPGYGAIFQA